MAVVLATVVINVVAVSLLALTPSSDWRTRLAGSDQSGDSAGKPKSFSGASSGSPFPS